MQQMGMNYVQQTWIKEPILQIKDLSLTINRFEKGLFEKELHVIRDFHLSINKGEIVAVVGASGSGKSMLASSIFGVIPNNATLFGDIYFENELLTKKAIESYRGVKMMLIPQMVHSLNPLVKVGKQVEEVLNLNNSPISVDDLFSKVGLDDYVKKKYPAHLSGGMVRRIFLAMVIASDAELIIADEPTTGLDDKAAKQTLKQLQLLTKENRGVMLITHDLNLVLDVAHKVVVFYAGETVEIVPSANFTGKGEQLAHPYTKALWNALPQNEFKRLEGNQPLSSETYNGCLFQHQCPYQTKRCVREKPPIKETTEGMVRCFYA